MAMKALTVVLLVALALVTVANATTHSQSSPEQLPTMPKQLRQRHFKLGARSTPTNTASGSIEEVPPFDGPFMEGDIVVRGLGNDINVVNGTSFEVKGSLQSELVGCVEMYGFAFSPDNSVLAVVCWTADPQQQVLVLITTDLSIVNTTSFQGLATCPADMECGMTQVLYMPSGDLLGTGSARNVTDSSNQLVSTQALANGTAIKSWIMTEAGQDYTSFTSLMEDGTTLVYTSATPDVMEFDTTANDTATALASVANSSCTSVVTLYGNTLLAGCMVTNDTFNGFCAHHLSAEGKALASWCTPSAYTRNVTGPDAYADISVAMDVDRKSFVVTIEDLPDVPGASVKGAAENSFRVCSVDVMPKGL
jgi:hypothetical protein